MNTDLLDKICDEILNEPRRFNMNEFFSDSTEITGEYGEEFVPPCGTAACIAGLTMTLSLPGIGTALSGSFIEREAARILDITPAQAERLFFAQNWPKEFDDLPHLPHTRNYALNAVARIQHFIETNGRE